MNPQPTNNKLLILILGLLTAIGPLSIDMYLPGFSAIAADLHTSIEIVGYSLSSFFVGICLGQLVSGPLLDRFGRKKPLYFGLSIYILASIGCALSNTVESLIFFRFIQALGGCVGMVAPSAVVRDVFPVDQSARVFSTLILILGVSPILAPTLGGYIVSGSGWKPIFLVTALITLLILVLVHFKLPETRKADKTFSLKPSKILGNFKEVLKDPQFITYALAGNIVSAGLFAYLAGSPFVFMELFKVSQEAYGWIFGLIAAGLITSSQFNSLLLKKYKSDQILKTVQGVQLFIGIVLVAGSIGGFFNLTGLIIVIMLFLSCQGFIFPNSAALAMAPFTNLAGSASAVMGAMQMAMGSFASALVGIFFNGTMIPMVVIMLVFSISGFIILLSGQKKLKLKNKEEMTVLAETQAMELIEKY
jgi:DHA1 family bicyclomycin/chloramphenicol resistance-like MFS transporter